MPPELLSGLIGGLVAAAVTMTGWFVTDYLRRRELKDSRRADFIERQITQFYAPLFFLAESERRYRQMREKATSVAPEDKKGALWWAFTDQFVVPTQLRIYDLLKANWHLLIESRMHASFDLVISHCTDALSLFELSKKGITTEGLPIQVMPDSFVDDLRADLDFLHHEYDSLKLAKRKRRTSSTS